MWDNGAKGESCMQKKDNFDEIKDNICKKFVWMGRNQSYLQTKITKHVIHVTREKLAYEITITRVMDTKWIEIETSGVRMGELYELANEVRSFEYLFDGAFYSMMQCKMDDTDIVEAIRQVELGYFQYAKRKRRILLNVTDREYQKYFCKWLRLERELGIINQMVLYAGNINGLPVDIRISMITECFESLIRKLESHKLIYKVHSRTLANCILSILMVYGEPVFKTEQKDWNALVRRIVKTRNKVFHVDSRNKDALDGTQSGFYAIKLDWLYRYIVWIMLGYDKKVLYAALEPEITAYEANFPQLIFGGHKKSKQRQSVNKK